jgi:hypothetical protein
LKSLLDYVDDILVLRWLNNQGFKIPVFDGDTIFEFNWKDITYKGKPNLIPITDEASRGTLKKIIEERLFPHL